MMGTTTIIVNGCMVLYGYILLCLWGYASVPVLSIAVAVWLVVCLPCSGLVYLYERSIC